MAIETCDNKDNKEKKWSDMKKVTIWINFVSEKEIRKFRQILWKGRDQEERMGIKKRDKGSDYMRGETKGITGGFGDKRKNYSIIFKEKNNSFIFNVKK